MSGADYYPHLRFIPRDPKTEQDNEKRISEQRAAEQRERQAAADAITARLESPESQERQRLRQESLHREYEVRKQAEALTTDFRSKAPSDRYAAFARESRELGACAARGEPGMSLAIQMVMVEFDVPVAATQILAQFVSLAIQGAVAELQQNPPTKKAGTK